MLSQGGDGYCQLSLIPSFSWSVRVRRVKCHKEIDDDDDEETENVGRSP